MVVFLRGNQIVFEWVHFEVDPIGDLEACPVSSHVDLAVNARCQILLLESDVPPSLKVNRLGAGPSRQFPEATLTEFPDILDEVEV